MAIGTRWCPDNIFIPLNLNSIKGQFMNTEGLKQRNRIKHYLCLLFKIVDIWIILKCTSNTYLSFYFEFKRILNTKLFSTRILVWFFFTILFPQKWLIVNQTTTYALINNYFYRRLLKKILDKLIKNIMDKIIFAQKCEYLNVFSLKYSLEKVFKYLTYL